MESINTISKRSFILRIILLKMRREEDIVDRLDKMIKRSCELVIQSLEKGVNLLYINRHLIDQKINMQVESLFVNTEAGIAKLLFETHAQAMNFYENRSFNDVLMNRKINVYFNISADRDDIKKYFIRGINQDNVRRVFEKCRRYGIIRMDTLYGYKSLLKPTCIISYLRQEPLNQEEFRNLQQQLGALNAKLDYFYEKQEKSILNQSQIKNLPQPKMPLPLPYPLPLPKVLPAAYEALKQFKAQEKLATLTFLTCHDEQQDEIWKSEIAIKRQFREQIGINVAQIWVDRAFLPTANPKLRRVLISRKVEFQEEQEAEQAYLNLQAYLKERNIDGIAYLFEAGNISTLLVTKTELFIVKIKEEKCVIYQRTEMENKSVKLAQFSYTEIDDVIIQRERMKATLFKASEINTFGQPYLEIMERVKEDRRR